jgi:hypothetical protein
MKLKRVASMMLLVTLFGLPGLAANQLTPGVKQRPALPPAGSAAASPLKPVHKAQAQGNTKTQQPCWQEVGISRAAIDQRRSIEQSTRLEIEGICGRPGLTDAERRAKIAEIRQSAQAQINAVISPEQRASLNACNKSRQPSSGARPGAGGGVPHPGGGPCAVFPGE